jgi:divalent metal cation (Fe/Co/Zn/Cd) transporter
MASGAVWASLAGAAGMTAAKFTAAAVGGSAGMSVEGARSTVNYGLMLLGKRRSEKPPDGLHPFGYGMELCFWSLVVASVLLAVGTVAEGVMRGLHPRPGSHAGSRYAVMAVAANTAGGSVFSGSGPATAAYSPRVRTSSCGRRWTGRCPGRRRPAPG